MNQEVDVELRVLLQEIAEGPRRSPLFTEIPRPSRIDLTTWQPISSRAARLTSAERHLLDVYRDDVAQIFRDAAEWKLLQSPVMEAQTARYVTPTERKGRSTPAESIRELEGVLHQCSPTWAEHEVTETGRLGCAMLANPATSAYQCAALSLKFASHGKGWIQLARAHLVDGRHSPARQLLSGTIRRSSDREVVGVAMSWIGVIYGMVGDSRSASRAQARAAAAQPHCPNRLLSWLCEAAVAEQTELALQAAEVVDDCLDSESPAFSDWLARRDRRMASGIALVSEAGRLHARRIANAVGPVSHRVIDGLQ